MIPNIQCIHIHLVDITTVVFFKSCSRHGTVELVGQVGPLFLFSAHFEGFGTHQTQGKSWNPVVFFLVSRNLEAVFTNSAATYARIIIYIHCFTTITPSPRWWKPPSKGPVRPSLSFGFALFDSETFRNFCWMLKSSFVVGRSEGSSFFMCLNLIIPLMVQKSETTTVWMSFMPL